EDPITIVQFAKILSNNDIEVGRNRLFSWFRDNGYLIKSGKDKNIPKQSYIKQGLFTVEERVVRTLEGEVISTTTLITGKGQLYFMDKFSF
ncbi:MAG: phage antirepressor KilAC domain-containing protein, partial [Romboutsia timonensis]